MKKNILFVLVMAVLLVSAALVSADDLSDVTLNGVLRFGTAPEYFPFVYYEENGNINGIDVALMEEVCRRMGVKMQTVDIAFDGLVDSLVIGQVDVIGRGMSRTESRLERIDFTRIYYKGEAQFISLSTLTKPATVDNTSFKNLKIGVEKATSFEQWVRENLVTPGYTEAKNVYIYSSATDLVKALNRKDVDVIVLDQDVYERMYAPSGNYQVFYTGFMQESYAFGLRKDSTLTSTVNGHLLDMLRDGTAQKIADYFFKMDRSGSSATISRPEAVQMATATPLAPVVNYPTQPAVPQPATCINSMVFYADVTIKDGQQVSPGERFRKIWRVYNNGSCTWTPGYSFVYVSGDRMNGQNISINQNVVPGQTIDLAVDLTAPTAGGTYRGNWQMMSPQGKNFGETIWVKVRVSGSQPAPQNPTPRPDDGQRYTPISVNSFYADSYEGSVGACTNVYWSTKGAAMVEITVDGTSVYKGDSVNGSKQVCGPLTNEGSHFVQLYAFNVTTDAYSSFTYTTRAEGQKRVVPQISYFYADPASGYMGDCTTVYWSVSNAAGIDIYANGAQIERSSNATGSASVCAAIQNIGTHSITLVAHSVTDDATASTVFTMKAREEEGGGWAGMNYYDNEQDQGGWAGSNYQDSSDYSSSDETWSDYDYSGAEDNYDYSSVDESWYDDSNG